MLNTEVKSMEKDELKARLDETMERFDIPSYSAAVCEHGNIRTFTGGLCDMENSAAPDEETIYAIGSCTKSFTAGAICTLADRGLLTLDDPVRKYIPELSMYDSYVTEHLTVRDMLCHRCGLPRYDLILISSAESVTEADILTRLKYMKPNAPFRYIFQYNNTMFALAGILIRRITGKPWQQIVKDNIMRPLGIARTAFSAEEALAMGNVAVPYLRDAGGRALHAIPHADIGAMGPAGCIYMSPRELLKWDMALMSGGEYNGRRILSQKMVKEMVYPQMIRGNMMTLEPLRKAVNNESYGLGLMPEIFEGHRLIQHGGNIDGFSSDQSFLPDDSCVFTVAINENGTRSSIVMRYAAAEYFLGGNLRWCGPCYDSAKNEAEAVKALSAGIMAAKPAAVPCPASNQDICGIYENELFGRLCISADGETLTVKLGNLEFSCLHYADQYFNLGGLSIAPDMLIESCVDMDISGNVVGFSAALEPAISEKIHFKRIAEK
jgi:CubicO group peptidase (beta-lactamase class C family)